MKISLPELFARVYRKHWYNPLIRKIILAKVNPDDVTVCLRGKEINDETKKLIEEANDEVLMQFYIFDKTSDAGTGIVESLIELNNKSESLNKRIRIKIMVDHRAGIAEWFTQPDPYSFDWLRKVKGTDYYSVDLDGKEIALANLKIKTYNHHHWFPNSYHNKVIIVKSIVGGKDIYSISLRTGDPCKDSDQHFKNEGWVQFATFIRNCNVIGKHAAESFKSRFKNRFSIVKKNYSADANVIKVRDDVGILKNLWIRFKKYARSKLYMFNLYNLTHIKIADPTANAIYLEKNPSTNIFKRLWFDGPNKLFLLEAIKSCKSSIIIMISNINDPDIREALRVAIENGVTVHLITGKYQFEDWEDNMLAGGTNEAFVAKLRQALPMRLWDRLQIRWILDSESTATLKRIVVNDYRESMHGKGVIFPDEEEVHTGSSPLDLQSSKFSAETDIIFKDKNITEKYLRVYNILADDNHSVSDNAVKLNILKSSLIMEIKKLIIKPIHHAAVSNAAQIAQQKYEVLNDLVAQINQAKSFAEIDDYMLRRVVPIQNNILAQQRRQLFNILPKCSQQVATFFSPAKQPVKYGQTATIQRLRDIYKLHFFEKYCRTDAKRRDITRENPVVYAPTAANRL